MILKVPKEIPTFQLACILCSDGDTILLGDGEYKGNFTIKNKSNITIMGESLNTKIIGLLTCENAYISMKRITLESVTSYSILCKK